MYLRTPLSFFFFFFAFDTSSGLKVCPFLDVDASEYSVLHVQVYLAFVLSLAALPHVLVPLEFCAYEALWLLYADGVVRTGGMHISHVFLKFHYPIGLLIQNTSSKLKWFCVQDSNIRIFEQACVPSDPVWLHMSHTSTCEVGMYRCVYIRTYYIFLARRCRPFIRFLKECLISQKNKTILC